MDFKKYVIIPTEDIDLVNFKDQDVRITNRDTAITSVDGTKKIIKYYNNPSSVAAIASRSQEYTREEILEILHTPEWFNPEVGP